jgi:N-acetylmuramoyl-L-alanine amidase
MSRLISLIIIHCAATPNGQHLGRDGQTAAQRIDEWHRERGFHRSSPVTNPDLTAIGYHYVIETDGSLLTGRDECEIGAHCLGHNSESIGVCMVGTDAFTVEQWTTLLNLTNRLQDNYRNARLAGHNEFSNKICPGFKVADWVAGDRQPLAGHICEAV